MAGTTMYLRGVRPALVRETKALAAREGVTLRAVVERALEREIHQVRGRSARLSEIGRDMEWYEANREALLERYEGRFIAIVDGDVVDDDADAEALAARISERYGTTSVFMPLCQREPRVVGVRSPRIA